MAKSVFHDIADDADEANNLTARSLLIIAIEERIREYGWTQTEAARVLRVSQPRVSDLMTGKIYKFSLDALVNMLPAVGLAFEVTDAPGENIGARPALVQSAGLARVGKPKVAASTRVRRQSAARKSTAAAKAGKSTQAR